MFLSMIPLYDYNYAGSNPLQLVLLLADFHNLYAQVSSILDCFLFCHLDGFFDFPLLFPTPQYLYTHSGCWDNFILMTICLTIFTSYIVTFYFGVEVLGQLNLLSTPIILLVLHRSSSVAVSGPGSARLWMLFVAVNECVCINPSSFLFLFSF